MGSGYRFLKMKNQKGFIQIPVLIVIIASTLVLGGVGYFPLSANAISGACSWHNGVNCAAGPTYDGKVVCNDSWVNSSVFFSDADECRVSLPKCYYPIQPSCSLSEIEQQKEHALSSSRGILIRSGLFGSDFGAQQQSQIENEYALKYSACQNMWNIYQSQIDGYNSCNEMNKKSMESEREYAKFQTELKSQYICDEYHPGSIFNKEKFSCECGNGEELFSISAERKERCVPSSFAKLMREFLLTSLSSSQPTSTENILITSTTPIQLPSTSTKSPTNLIIKKQEVEKIIVNEATTTSPSIEIKKMDKSQKKLDFFYKTFGSIKSFFSRVFSSR